MSEQTEREAIAAAIFDPGATEGYKGDRTLTEWQTDAVMRVLSVRPQAEAVAWRDILPLLKNVRDFLDEAHVVGEPPEMALLRGPLSRRATSAEFNEWQAREIVAYVDRIRSALVTRPDAQPDTEAETGGV